MANNAIINRWDTFKSFFKTHGGFLQYVTFVNSHDGQEFKRPRVGSTFLSFSKALGYLTPEQLKAVKDDLAVVQLEVDEETAKKRREKGIQVETYCLCKRGENALQVEDVDLGWD